MILARRAVARTRTLSPISIALFSLSFYISGIDRGLEATAQPCAVGQKQSTALTWPQRNVGGERLLKQGVCFGIVG